MTEPLPPTADTAMGCMPPTTETPAVVISSTILPPSPVVLRLMAGRSKRLRAGHPWIYSNEIHMTPEVKALPGGTLVQLEDAGGEKLGTGSFNAHSLIAFRLFDRDVSQEITVGWVTQRLERALALRDLLFPRPFYRLIHSEADGLPGLIIDRYGDVFTLQANTAGMDRLTPLVLEALEGLFHPRAIVLRNDSPARGLEGLEQGYSIARGTLDGPVELEENGVRFLADLTEGQKTGWFYDQRDNRAAAAQLAAGRRVIDFYTYAGGFALQAAQAGARETIAVDRSEGSLALARQAAALNALTVECRRAEAFGEMERLAKAGEKFGLVIADPPAFVKSKKDLASGLKGYRKMAKLAANLVEPGGFLLLGSCSHHVSAEAFAEETAQGLAGAGRTGRILRAAGAGADHPVHPQLPESAYLKALLFQLD